MARTKEIWLPVRGWETKYEVSNRAHVRSIRTGLVLSPLTAGCPYYYHMFYNPKMKQKNKRVKVYLHRMVASHFVVNPYLHNEVNHKDGNKLNCMPDNLEWVSKSENSKHAVATGLHRPWFMDHPTLGEEHKNAKLSWDKVADARTRYEAGKNGGEKVTIKALAIEFGVSYRVMNDVLLYRSWKPENKIIEQARLD